MNNSNQQIKTVFSNKCRDLHLLQLAGKKIYFLSEVIDGKNRIVPGTFSSYEEAVEWFLIRETALSAFKEMQLREESYNKKLPLKDLKNLSDAIERMSQDIPNTTKAQEKSSCDISFSKDLDKATSRDQTIAQPLVDNVVCLSEYRRSLCN